MNILLKSLQTAQEDLMLSSDLVTDFMYCVECGKRSSIHRFRYGAGERYCSEECEKVGDRSINKFCVSCGKPHDGSNYNICCSNECETIWDEIMKKRIS